MSNLSRLLVSFALVGIAALSGAPVALAASSNVAFISDSASGTIVVRTGERRLYLVLGDGRALRYVVGVGRAGRQWSGASTIDGKYLRPNWAPPDTIRQAQPELPALIPSGAPNNPMGAAAMTLAGGQYAIHGTNAPSSIGGFVSYGCIRMYNSDIADLYARVSIGTVVLVTR